MHVLLRRGPGLGGGEKSLKGTKPLVPRGSPHTPQPHGPLPTAGGSMDIGGPQPFTIKDTFFPPSPDPRRFELLKILFPKHTAFKS